MPVIIPSEPSPQEVINHSFIAAFREEDRTALDVLLHSNFYPTPQISFRCALFVLNNQHHPFKDLVFKENVLGKLYQDDNLYKNILLMSHNSNKRSMTLGRAIKFAPHPIQTEWVRIRVRACTPIADVNYASLSMALGKKEAAHVILSSERELRERLTTPVTLSPKGAL